MKPSEAMNLERLEKSVLMGGDGVRQRSVYVEHGKVWIVLSSVHRFYTALSCVSQTANG